MAKSVLLVGQGSHLARAVLKTPGKDISIDSVSHGVDWDGIHLSSYQVVVNMAYDFRYMREAYDERHDFDLFVAQQAARAGCHYVMMSTRRVYGPSAPFPVTEKYPPAPIDHYGSNKLKTERAVQELLGERCTILRIANVFDFEPGRHTFFGIALRSLKETNRIILDVSPFVRRDFIDITEFAQITRRVLEVCPSGVFNLGSGHATEVGRIALWLIEGYGQGELLVTSTEQRDSFELDHSKLGLALGSLRASSDIRRRCIEIGSRLIHE
jgi:dTDP-4-dehydrorhamnose reductase/UDP-glucose 4-epimerase